MNDFFHAPHAAARSYLLAKVFLLLLALDAWALMIGHAGRYGAAGFNVAHFRWLDALQPVPSSAFYIGVLLLAGLLSITLLLSSLSRRLMLLLFALYTYAWAMSLLDSYQHHYFVSIILVCFAFFPKVSARDIHPAPLLAEAGKLSPRERERLLGIERKGVAYAVVGLAIVAIYCAVESKGRVFTMFAFGAGALALAIAWLAPRVRPEPHKAQGFGWNLLGATVAIVYLYTALAKTDPAWLGGHTIQRIGTTKADLAWLAQWAAAFGVSEQRFWSVFATLVIPQELALAGAYVCAVMREHQPSKLLDAICALGAALAVALHVGAEAMGLEIGWFSHYMLLFAATYLLPAGVVDKLAVLVSFPARYGVWLLERWERAAPARGMALLAVALGAGAIMGFAWLTDLPGAVPAAACMVAGLLVASGLALARGTDPRRLGVSTALAACVMWLAIAASPARWDYYRFLAGDLDKRGQPEAALAAYEQAESYAPKGLTRKNKIDDLRKRLGR